MKVVLLAGGYATRLWPLTKDTPKALLQVGEKTMLEHVLHILEKMPSVSTIYLTTNEKFAPNFGKFIDGWKGKKKVELVIERSTSNENKLGAVGGLLRLWKSGKLDEDSLVMAADNIFDAGISGLLNEMAEAKEDAIVLHDVGDKGHAKNYGVCKLGRNGIVSEFEEKPSNPKSTLVSTGCYVLGKETLALLPDYEQGGGGTDRIGDFIKWLVGRGGVHGHVYTGRWFDIGTHEHLERARKAHTKK